MGSQSVSVAVGVVFDDQGNVMLARTTYGARQIGPPGGRIEQGESPVAAARREFSEETGFEIHVDRLIEMYSFTDQDHEALVYAFLCSIVRGELRIPRAEISEVIWSDPRSLPEPADVVCPLAIADALEHNWGVVREGLVWKPR
jgi:ADP-ribose pyrophosphatase YjhB (NUDIX family)